jgi:thiol:disulfide interchange protein DsbD
VTGVQTCALPIWLSQRLSPYFVKAPDPVEGVLVLSGPAGETAYQVRAEPGPVAPVPGSVAPVAQAELKDRKSATELLLALGLALLGGLILNLMPCVFPVLALKALSVLNSGGHSTVEQRRHALAYTAGVIGSFCAVAALLIGLRAGGQALGWGFQLQSPPFVALLAYLMFAMGLSLSGAVQFGTRWMGLGQSLTAAPGVRGSFFTGVLAVIVASPCTAPFMGPALGFALTQPAAVSLLVFFALGVGLAMPFLILGFAPGLARRLPRPGRWMETFKQAMAFPMYLTAIWLLWVLGGLTSRDGMALILVGMLLLGFGLWIPTLSRRRAARWIGYLMLALAVVMPFDPSVQRQAAAERQAGVHEPYSDARFQALRAEGRSVFVDFTADWCLTCKLNEQGALRASSVRETFAQHNVVTLMGDWTRADPAITAVLERYGRSGVPLYLASKNGAEPVVLPQVLTPSIVNDAFR